MKIVCSLLTLFLMLAFYCNADDVVWKGLVNSNGDPSSTVNLIPGQLYKIKVNGSLILGNWSKNGQPLVNDANYEFNAVGKPTNYPVFKNSLEIPIGDGKFHDDHTYESSVFKAPRDNIYFWIFDSYYGDNKGSLNVEISQVNSTAANPTVIWQGAVSADGAPSPNIPIEIGKTYQIVTSGFMSLGTWSKNGKQMMNDACYEFNAIGFPVYLASFNNTNGISVCDGKYHPNHIYQSAPFVADKNSISFWIFDTDYSDNTGAIQVQLNLVK